MRKGLYILIAIFVLTACGSRTQTATRPTLTVTLEPLRYFTEAIAGDKFEVVSMVPEGSSPETYDPTPQQLVGLSKSTAYLRIGYIGFEQAWMKKLQANCPDMKVFDTSRGVDLIRAEGHWHGNHFHEGGVEPHIWNSAENAAIICTNICNALCELDSVNGEYYRHRLDDMRESIARLDRNLHTMMEKADSTFLIYHPALTYFARDYGLKQISIEEGGKEPSPAQLKALIETCRKEKAGIIFVQREFDTRNAELIAKELGVEVVPINPLSYHWQEEMLNVARALTPKASK